ncbi:SHOCT domain-containing protein [Solirhodobacter olei]|uniref:SHOCT domain-containing protein n=1 Tax=Solirhodobacter olei TaxID=2493082 RepID=UPI0019D4B76A|nr:SHOCT domain-containing protein [Solirhodobacter olei]
MKLLKTLAIALPLNAVAIAALADAPGPGNYYGHMMGGYGYGPGFFGMGVMILFWAILIGAVVIAVRWLMERDHKRSNSALDILKERLARGEIEPEEYEARRKVLEA